MAGVAPEQALGRIQKIMRERAAEVSAAYAAFYESSAGGPETGVYALLRKQPFSGEQRAQLEK